MSDYGRHRIAIIGATGDLGSSFLRHSVDRGVQISVLVRSGSRRDLKIPSSKHCDVISIKKRSKYDIPLKRLIEGATCVFNFAGQLRESESLNSEYVRSLITNNVLFPSLVAAFCAKSRTPLVQMSSGEAATVKLADVKTSLRQLDKYFDSLGTSYAKYSPNTLNELAVELVRKLPNLYGPGGYAHSKLMGEYYGFLGKQYFATRLENAYGPGFGRDRLVGRLILARIHGYDLQVRDERRDYLYIEDFCHAMLELANVIAGAGRAIVRLRSGATVSTSHLVNRIEALLPHYYGRCRFLPQPTPKSESPNGSDNWMRWVHCPQHEIRSLVKMSWTSLRGGLGKTIEALDTDLKKSLRSGRGVFRVPHGQLHRKTLYGGSVAGKWLVIERKPDRRRFVRKIARDWGVGGSGIPKLRAETAFYRFIARNSGTRALSKLYPRVLRAQNDESLSVLEMEYISDGRNVAQLLSQGERFDLSLLEQLLSTMLRSGYSTQRLSLDTEQSEDRFVGLYIRRPISRLRFTTENMLKGRRDTVLHAALCAKFLTVNGKRCQNPSSVLMDVHRTGINDRLRPRTGMFCAHGDLTILNMIMDQSPSRLRLIDPRGFVGMWDPLYDFGKLAFSIGGFADIMLGSFDIERRAKNSYAIKCDKIAPMRHLETCVEEMLNQSPDFRWVANREPFWRSRIRFAAATHYLADVPYRVLSKFDVNRALAAYLLGTLQLNSLIEEM